MPLPFQLVLTSSRPGVLSEEKEDSDDNDNGGGGGNLVVGVKNVLNLATIQSMFTVGAA